MIGKRLVLPPNCPLLQQLNPQLCAGNESTCWQTTKNTHRHLQHIPFRHIQLLKYRFDNIFFPPVIVNTDATSNLTDSPLLSESLQCNKTKQWSPDRPNASFFLCIEVETSIEAEPCDVIVFRLDTWFQLMAAVMLDGSVRFHIGAVEAVTHSMFWQKEETEPQLCSTIHTTQFSTTGFSSFLMLPNYISFFNSRGSKPFFLFSCCSLPNIALHEQTTDKNLLRCWSCQSPKTMNN